MIGPISKSGRGGRGEAGGGGERGARPEFGSDLVLRTLADGAERTFSDVVEFTLTDDGKQLVYAVSAQRCRQERRFRGTPRIRRPGNAAARRQRQISGVDLGREADRDGVSQQPRRSRFQDAQMEGLRLGSSGGAGQSCWHRRKRRASPRDSRSATRGTSACPKMERASISAARPRSRKRKTTPTPPSRRRRWWISGRTRTITSSRSRRSAPPRDRDRTFTAVYSIPDHKLVQLGDPKVETVTPSENTAMGAGHRRPRIPPPGRLRRALQRCLPGRRRYRRAQAGIAEKSHGQATWSPNGRYLLLFDGKDWSTISVPDGKTTNLTAGLRVKFWNEETDTPSTPPPYGSAGWTKDGQAVLLYDRYDIWRVAPDGSGAKNITAGYGRGARYAVCATSARKPIRASTGSTPQSRCCFPARI